MKKIQLLFVICIFAVAFQVIFISWDKRVLQFDFDDENNLLLSVRVGNEEINILPYFDEKSGITYFFLPSFINNRNIFCDKKESQKIRFNGALVDSWGGKMG